MAVLASNFPCDTVRVSDGPHYIDEDTTDDFLDAAEQGYEDGRTMSELATWAATADNAEPLPLPPLTAD